jgi:tripartite ATP-independent transporter DctM subunit
MIDRIAADMKRKSNGRIVIQSFSGGQRGGSRDMIDAFANARVLGVFVYRDFRLRDLPRIVLDTVETTGVVMALVMTAALMGYTISVSRLPQEFGATLTGLTASPLVYLLIVNVLLLVVGCFMEALSAMLVLIPILVPTAVALGIDPVQFGLVFVLNLMIGTITPPVGIVLYVTAKVAAVPFDRMARAVLPYLVPLFAVLALITVWPAATTWLPTLLLAK